MKRLFIVKNRITGKAWEFEDEVYYTDFKGNAKTCRDALGKDWKVSPGPDHWRNV